MDARVTGIAEELRTASTKDDLQDVGRRCREILIDTARLLADPHLVPAGQQPPKAADATTWLDPLLRATAAGRSHAELRAFVPSACASYAWAFCDGWGTASQWEITASRASLSFSWSPDNYGQLPAGKLELSTWGAMFATQD